MAEDVKFDEEGLLRKIRFGADFGSIKMESAFEALQLFYVAQSPSCPEENKPYIADFIEELTRLLPFFIMESKNQGPWTQIGIIDWSYMCSADIGGPESGGPLFIRVANVCAQKYGYQKMF